MIHLFEAYRIGFVKNKCASLKPKLLLMSENNQDNYWSVKFHVRIFLDLVLFLNRNAIKAGTLSNLQYQAQMRRWNRQGQGEKCMLISCCLFLFQLVYSMQIALLRREGNINVSSLRKNNILSKFSSQIQCTSKRPCRKGLMILLV